MKEPVNVAIVCIIDDEACVGRSLERVMRAAGMRAQSFTSVEEFLEMNCWKEASCIVCDISMPGMSGLELPAVLRRIEKHIPVIFLTGNDTPEMRAQAQLAGGAGFFRKPVDDQALLDAIEWAIRGGATHP